MGEAVTWKQFNGAFGRVLRFLGYAPLGTAIGKDKVSAYLIWCKHPVPEMYFSNELPRRMRSLDRTTNEIERPHRRFLNDLFREGQEAVIEASRSKRTLVERVKSYIPGTSSSEGCRIYKAARKLPRRYDSGKVVYSTR